MEIFETEVFRVLTLIDADSLAYAYGILGLAAPEQER